MTIRVGYIPYLNMEPFHQGFGPRPLEKDGIRLEFYQMSPRTLGQEAEKGTIDAGAMSLVDYLKLADTFEPVGSYAIGLKQQAQSVLLFSKGPLAELEGVCVVTGDTSTSFRLLQVLLEVRYGRKNVRYGRIASSALFDGEGDALLLIGDEAMQAKKDGIRGFAVVTDLGQEWYAWQGTPFVFARWVVRRDLEPKAKAIISQLVEKSLNSILIGSKDELEYWRGFSYLMTPDHEKSIEKFKQLAGTSSFPAVVSGEATIE